MEDELKYRYKYPHPAVAADCAIFGFDGNKVQILLIERGNYPYEGFWAVPGGFVNMDETTDKAAIRELMEETGVAASNVELYGVFSEPDRDPRERVITIGYFSVMRKIEVEGADDAAKADWFDIDKLPPLAFDHDEGIRLAVNRCKELLNNSDTYINGLLTLFTLDEVNTITYYMNNVSVVVDSI